MTTMQTTRPIKYNFDTVFGSKGAPASASAPVRSSYSSDEVEAIRRDVFAQGKADTHAQAAAAQAATLSAVANGLAATIGKLDAAVLAMRQESAALALNVGRKLAATALESFPMREVEALVADCLNKLHQEPRIVIRVSQACAELLRNDIDTLCQTHGFAGRVVVLAEPALNGADCRIEWADGGIERDLADTFATIEQCAERWRSSPAREES